MGASEEMHPIRSSHRQVRRGTNTADQRARRIRIQRKQWDNSAVEIAPIIAPGVCASRRMLTIAGPEAEAPRGHTLQVTTALPIRAEPPPRDSSSALRAQSSAVSGACCCFEGRKVGGKRRGDGTGNEVSGFLGLRRRVQSSWVALSGRQVAEWQRPACAWPESEYDKLQSHTSLSAAVLGMQSKHTIAINDQVQYAQTCAVETEDWRRLKLTECA